MDIHSASPDELAPLPFHGMKRYPYAAPEAYPLTPARRAYVERYNTRVVAKALSPLLPTGEGHCWGRRAMISLRFPQLDRGGQRMLS